MIRVRLPPNYDTEEHETLDVFTKFLPPDIHVSWLFDLVEKYRDFESSTGLDRFKIQKWSSRKRTKWNNMTDNEKDYNRRYIVYVLQNSGSKSLVYVGCTHDPENRYMEHNGLRHFIGYKKPHGATCMLETFK